MLLQSFRREVMRTGLLVVGDKNEVNGIDIRDIVEVDSTRLSSYFICGVRELFRCE